MRFQQRFVVPASRKFRQSDDEILLMMSELAAGRRNEQGISNDWAEDGNAKESVHRWPMELIDWYKKGDEGLSFGNSLEGAPPFVKTTRYFRRL